MVLKISLPEDVRCLVKEDCHVDFSTPFYEMRKEKEIDIPVSKRLGIASDKIFLHLKKLVGEKIEKNEILASKKSLFFENKIVSPEKGIIREINHDKGDIILEIVGNDKKTVNCYFTGKIKKVSEKEIELEILKTTEFSLKITTDDFGAETFYLDKEYPNLSETDVSGKIIITELISSFLETKLEALGATGFVTINKLPETSGLNYCQLKNINDLEKIRKLKLTYCLIDKKSDRILFYS